jgi:hypothetical protein
MAARERNAAMAPSSIRLGLAISQPSVPFGLLWKIAQNRERQR